MKIIFLCVLLLIHYNIISQTISVRNSETDAPIEMVLISSNNSEVIAYTDSEGVVDIYQFRLADSIVIKAFGFSDVVKSYDQLSGRSSEISLQPTSINIDEVVISATRWHQSSSKVSAAIAKISSKKVNLYNPQTTADLLSISGKVFVQKSQQGGGSPMYRGYAANRLLYVVDGIRMNSAIFRSGNIQNVISIDPFSIESAEVSFGPSSVIYGSDAIGGVMTFNTISPKLSSNNKVRFNGNVVTRYSSANNEHTGHCDINLGFNKWAVNSSLSRFNFDDLKQGSHGPEDYVKPFYVTRVEGADIVLKQENSLLQIPSAYSQLNYSHKIKFNPNNRWNFVYGLYVSETSQYGRYDRHNRLMNNTPRYAEWDYGPQVWRMNSLAIDHTSDGVLFNNMSFRLGKQYFEESRISRSMSSIDRLIQTEKVDAYSINIDFLKNIKENFTLNYGSEYVLNRVKSEGETEDIVSNIYIDAASRYPKSIWQSLAAYVNTQYEFSNKLTINGGVRYNIYDVDSRFDTTFYKLPFTKAHLTNSAITGSVGCVFAPSNYWIFRTTISSGFRAPNVDDIGKVFDSEPGAVVVPNPDLNAEHVYNIDVGGTKIIPNKMKIGVTGYYSILFDAMVRRDFNFYGEDSILYDGELSKVQSIQNASSLNVYGVQLNIELKITRRLTVLSDYNLQKGEVELYDGTTSPSRHITPSFGTTKINYKSKKVSVMLYASYQGKMQNSDMAVEEQSKTEIYALDSNGNTYVPNWYTLNAKMIYRCNKLITFSGGIENITDQRYRAYSSGISGAGRNFILSTKIHF